MSKRGEFRKSIDTDAKGRRSVFAWRFKNRART